MLAQAGFTGAPALTIEEAPPDHWADLGSRWLSLEQYFKPYPVCRWAQAPPIEGVLTLRARHGLTAADVDRIEVETFHESVRLATSEPQSTDAAQYSTSFPPCAVAMVRGDVCPADIADDALTDPEVLRLSRSMVMEESDHANAAFPATRLARTRLVLRDGTTLQGGDWMEPKWDPACPPSAAELRNKFRSLAGGVRAVAIEAAVATLPLTGSPPRWPRCSISRSATEPPGPDRRNGPTEPRVPGPRPPRAHPGRR